MITEIIKLANSDTFYGYSEIIEIAKGKNDLKMSNKEKKKRKWLLDKK